MGARGAWIVVVFIASAGVIIGAEHVLVTRAADAGWLYGPATPVWYAHDPDTRLWESEVGPVPGMTPRMLFPTPPSPSAPWGPFGLDGAGNNVSGGSVLLGLIEHEIASSWVFPPPFTGTYVYSPTQQLWVLRSGLPFGPVADHIHTSPIGTPPTKPSSGTGWTWRIRWPAFLMNTAALSAAVLVALRLVQIVVRRSRAARRRRRGRCPGCGYPRHPGEGPCPECNAAC